MIIKKITAVVTLIILIFSAIGVKEGHASGYSYSGEKSSDAIGILKNDAVFTTNCDSYFINGIKYKYFDSVCRAYDDENGVSMVPCKLISEALGVEISCASGKIVSNGKEVRVGSKTFGNITLDASPCEKNGVYYVPVISYVRNVLGKYAYCDGRGFVIISNSQRNYSNSDYSAKTEEESDIVCRYMQFERPDENKLYNAVKNHSGKTHPRMFIKANEIDDFKTAVSENIDLKKELHTLMEKCEKHVNSPVVPYEFTDYEGPRLIGQFRKVRDVLYELGVAYLATGNEKYANRLWEECENVLSWENWNMYNDGSGFLDSSEAGAGIAFAYDVLYNWLSEEQKQFFREEIEKKYLNYCLNVMEGKIHFKIRDGRMTHSNWGAVCGSSMFLVSMAFIDDLPEGDPFTEKCKFIARGALQALEFPMGTLFPDGAINEGLEYWTFYVKNLALSVKTLCNMCGEDFGFLSAKGLKESIEFALNIQSVNGGVNYLSTSGEGKQLIPELFAVADIYDDNESMQVLKKYFTASNVNIGALGLLFYKPSDADEEFDNLPLDSYFTGQKITTLRGGYADKNATYIAILGGHNGTDSHYDKGSFVFELGGERWISEVGAERKDVYGGYYHAEGWNLYRKRTEGHNSLVINPYDNTAVKNFIKNNTNNAYNVFCDDSRYVGQTIGTVAESVRFESKDKGAISVYDLTDTYGKQVKDYKRGFYLGDDRNSLTVRDELTLSEENSKIYWGLHTLGKITEIGKNYAVIEKNGKRLKIEILTNIPDFKLENTQAQPLDTSMIREVGVNGVYKEFSRDSFRKLMLSGEASGEIYISAKLYLENDKNISSHENSSISSWNIPGGDRKKSLPKPYEDFKITSSEKMVADGEGIITISADIPYKPDELAIYVNDKKHISKTDGFNVNGKDIFSIDTKKTDSSNLNIRIDYISGGEVVSVEKSVLVHTSYSRNDILKKTYGELTQQDTARDIHYKIMNDICLYFDVAGFSANGDGKGNMKFTFNKAGETNAGFLYKKNLGIGEDESVLIKWKLTTNDFVKMYMALKDSQSVKTSPSRIDTFPVYTGTYTYEFFADGEIYKYSVQDDNGEYLYRTEGVMKSENGGISEFQLKFYSVTDNSSLLIHSTDISVFEYEKVISSIKKVTGGTKIYLSREDDMRVIKVVYSDDNSKIEEVSFEDASEILIPENTSSALFVRRENLFEAYSKPVRIFK